MVFANISKSFLGAALLLALAQTATARVITLNAKSLPSKQGWTYSTSDSSVPEASIFSVSKGVLHQNTLVKGSFSARYNRSDVNVSKPFSMTIRARILAQDNGSDASGFDFGFLSGTWTSIISFGASGIIEDGFHNVLTTGIDTSVFHDYRLDGVPGSSYKFYIDGVLITTGSGNLYPYGPMIEFGDSTPTGSNSQAEIASYSFTQSKRSPPYRSFSMTSAQ